MVPDIHGNAFKVLFNSFNIHFYYFADYLIFFMFVLTSNEAYLLSLHSKFI